MTNAIRGKVTSSGGGSPLTNVKVEFALNVGLEFEPRPVVDRSTGQLPPWTAMTTSSGLFTIALTDEDVEKILGTRRHRELVFRVYDSTEIIIGTQMAYVSRALFRGNQTVSLTANPSYSLFTGMPTFSVSGFVTQADGAPLSNRTVIVYKKTMRGQTQIATGTSGADGRFMIRYPGTAGGHSDFADFTIYLAASSISASTASFCNPPADLTVRLVQNNATYVGKSSHTLDHAILNGLLDTATFDQLNPDDVRFMQCRTELDRSTVTTMARAHALSAKYPALTPDTYVAFAHAGIPLSTTSVTGLTSAEITSAVNQAVADNVVPPTLTAQLPTIISTLAAARVDRMVPAVNPHTTPVGSILVAAGLASGKPRAFAVAYAAHTGTAEEFWADLRADVANFGPTLVDKIQFALQVGALSGGHAPLVKYLDGRRTAGDFTRASELAKYTEANWVSFMGELVDGVAVHTPAGVPGTSVVQRSNYAAAITRMIADLYPSAHLAYRLPAGSVTANVAAFVVQNPDFSFDRTYINAFMDDAVGLPALPADREILRQDLLKVQRVFAMSPRYGRTETAVALLSAGVTTAAQIQGMGLAAFRGKFGGILDADSLAAVYEKADQIATAATHAWLQMNAKANAPTTNVIPTPACGDPELEELFHNLDYCACTHCNSVLGPAAYFTDLMHFLKQRHYGGLNLSLHDLLNISRPELRYIDLNCKNSDTPVPTIDLIIEVLEARAHMPLGLVGWPNLNRQTTWNEEDLLVYPEHINTGVYDELAKPAECYRPFLLPFDLHLEDARAYLQVLGTSRVALQDAFEWFDGFEATQVWRVDERLGLSKGQSDLVRDVAGMPSLEQRWGFPEGSNTWGGDIQNVELFMERAGLDFPGVQELLRTRMFVDETKIVYATPCTLKDAAFRDMTNEAEAGFDIYQLRHIERFLRVKRALGWTTAELDSVLHGLGASLIMAGLDTLAQFVRLRQRFARLPLGEVLSWFAPLDRHEYVEGEPSYYDQVVRPKIRDAAFTALDDTEPLKDFRGDLLGILKVDESELDAIIAVTGLTGDDNLTLANLSKLYRVVSIARAVDLPVDELITLTHYTSSLHEGAGPFAGTSLAPVRELIDLAEAVKRSSLSVPALDWFIRNEQKDKFGAGDLDVTRTFIGLITALQQAHTDHQQSLPAPELAKIDRVAKLLALFLSAEDTKAAVEFITKQTLPVPDNTAALALRDQLLFFVDPASPAGLQFANGDPAWGTVEARVELILPVVEAYVRQQRLESVVIRQLAVALSLEVADADMLLRKFTFTQVDQTALTILSDDGFFSTASYSVDVDAPAIKNVDFPALFLDRDGVKLPAALYRDLRRVALVASTFSLGPGLLRWLLEQPADPQVTLPNFAALPPDGNTNSQVYAAFAGWDWLRRATDIRDNVLENPERLTVLLDQFFLASLPLDWKSEFLELLAVAADWDVDALAAFEAVENIEAVDLKRLEAIEAFASVFRISAQLGVDPVTAHAWASEITVSAPVAAAIRAAAQAKFKGADWTSIARPIRNHLREKQRDALVAFLMKTENIKDRDDLFGVLLMDVDLAPCNKTTRLLFGTAALQLFMQRALMGLIPAVTLTPADSDEWSWMKRYRVWEANRKLFLYPENWVQPELRDDKTPLFERFTAELAQGGIDEATIEKAYIHYLEGLHEVSHLDVSGMYHELEGTKLVEVDRMHVFARSPADPTKLFYRRREDDAYWTPWEELPFPVEHKGVLPVVTNRRMMLIWPKSEFVTKQPLEGEKLPTFERRITLRWAERQYSQWGSVHTASDFILTWQLGSPLDTPLANERDTHNDISLASWNDDHGLQVAINRRIWESGTYMIKIGQAVYDSCRNTLALEAVAEQYNNHGYSGKLDGPWPAPTLYRYYQAFPFSDSVPRYIKMPVDGNKTTVLSEPIIRHPDGVYIHVSIPKQDERLDGSRPFIYNDPYAALYLRPSNSGIGQTDANLDKLFLHEIGEMHLLPYFGLAGITTPYQPPPTDNQITKELSAGDSIATLQQWTPVGKHTKYAASVFYHPYTCLFLERVRRFGVAGLLDPVVATQGGDVSLQYQAVDQPLAPGHEYFDDKTVVYQEYPTADIDFRYGGAYSVYNWEMFFHIPMYIADRLMAENRFEEAQRWLGYIFDPTRPPHEVGDTDCMHYWNFKVFRENSEHMSIADLLELLHYPGGDNELIGKKKEMIDQIAQSRLHPFRPHTLARLRPTAYMRATVMKYLDNLIAWGDDLFRQDTRESTQEAAQLYLLALQILGKRPRKIDGDERPDKDYNDAASGLDAFSNFLVELENHAIGFGKKDVPFKLDVKAQADAQWHTPAVYQWAVAEPPTPQGTGSDAAGQLHRSPTPNFRIIVDGDDDGPTTTRLYFCVPPNDKLLGYWDIVADRLFKLRNCLNIEGVRRDLALYDPPIDPGLLARAVAQGIDIGTAISNLYAPLPQYRFLPHLGVAKEFVGHVSNLGGALLQALEKRDAEALADLRARHEVALLKEVRLTKALMLQEAQQNIAALRRSRDLAVLREQYYSSREFMSELEQKENEFSLEAGEHERSAGHSMRLSTILSNLPTMSTGFSGNGVHSTVSIGGQLLALPSQLNSQRQNVLATAKTREANRAATMASYVRRKDEWKHQLDLARAEIKQIDAQITAAEIRTHMAQVELANHDKQSEQAREALEFMQTKFTNAELYSWMSGEISKVYYQAYQMALDLSRRAERCYRYELAIANTVPEFVQFGHWDNRRQGLLAGERLAHDLRRMEVAYYENHRREYELTKRISLANLDPVALVALRKTGACHFSLPSVIFDLDHASHYLRRIKLVSVAMPAVTGPYTNVGVTLTYLSGKTRPAADGTLAADGGALASVAISVNQDDSGLFEPNLRDERYLPFEGRGVEESHWRLELPDVVRQYDYETISDVILTIRYTAREGGEITKGLVGDLKQALDGFKRYDQNPEHGEGQVHIFSARAEFPEAWRSFVAAGSGMNEAALSLDLTEERFPHPPTPGGTRKITYVAIFARWPSEAQGPAGNTFDLATLHGPGGNLELSIFKKYAENAPPGEDYDYIHYATSSTGLTRDLGAWTLTLPEGWIEGLDPEDFYIVVGHSLVLI